MIHPKDELLNKYIDNELDSNELNELNRLISEKPEMSDELRSMKIVDNTLKEMEIISAPEGITFKIMYVIDRSAKTIRKQVPYLFYSVVTFFSIGILGLVGYAASLSKGESTTITETINKASKFIPKGNKIIDNSIGFLSAIFSSKDIYYIGIVLTLLLLISAYILIDSHKQIKNKIEHFS